MPTSPTLLTDWFFRPDTLVEHNMPATLPALFDIVDKHSRVLPKISRFEDFTTRVSNVFAGMMNDETSPRNAAENARVEAEATLQ